VCATWSPHPGCLCGRKPKRTKGQQGTDENDDRGYQPCDVCLLGLLPRTAVLLCGSQSSALCALLLPVLHRRLVVRCTTRQVRGCLLRIPSKKITHRPPFARAVLFVCAENRKVHQHRCCVDARNRDEKNARSNETCDWEPRRWAASAAWTDGFVERIAPSQSASRDDVYERMEERTAWLGVTGRHDRHRELLRRETEGLRSKMARCRLLSIAAQRSAAPFAEQQRPREA
jgi:hypothetical protein